MQTRFWAAVALGAAGVFMGGAAGGAEPEPVHAIWGTTWSTDLLRCDGWVVAGAEFEVSPTKADGRPWDGDGSAPDIVVVLQEREKAPAWTISLPKVQNKLTGQSRLNEPEPLPAKLARRAGDRDDGDGVVATAIVKDADPLGAFDTVGVVPLRMTWDNPIHPAILSGSGGQTTSLRVYIGLRGLNGCPQDVVAKYAAALDAERCRSGTFEAKSGLKAIFTVFKSAYAEKGQYPTGLGGFSPAPGAKYVYSAKLTATGFLATAVGASGEGKPDIWTINEENELVNTTVGCPELK